MRRRDARGARPRAGPALPVRDHRLTLPLNPTPTLTLTLTLTQTRCEITAYRSALPCFAAGGASPVAQMRERLMLDVPDDQLAARVQGLIDRSYDSSGTAAYDLYQQMSNGIRQ